MRIFLLSGIISVCLGLPAFANNAQVLESYGKIPLAFTVNQGQIDSQVRFTASGSGCNMFFTPSKTVFVLSKETEESATKRAAAKTAGTPEEMEPGKDSEREYESFAIQTEFVGANSKADVVGEDRLSWNNNYFFGSDRSKWQTDVPNYAKVRLLDIYNGVDLVYYGNKNRMKYDFVVKPGENPSKIAVKYNLGENEANALSVNAKGQLVVNTPLGELIENKPYCYQKIDGKEIEVEISYKIIDPENNIFGFENGKYDTGYELCIDPELIYSTFIGGDNREDEVNDIAIDTEGNSYITGHTNSFDYPVTSGTIDTSYNGANGDWDAFVTKLNSSGTSLIFSTFLGGSNSDNVNGIAVDSDGNAFITGGTGSYSFPVTSGAFNTKLNGGNVFVTKLNSSGNSLIYSTSLGFSANGSDIAIDSEGNAYIAGETNSSNYPVTVGSYDTSYNGRSDYYNGLGEYSDAFVTKLNSSGTSLVYSTYIGGKNHDSIEGIAIDTEGNAYITGFTYSSDYPVTSGAYDTIFIGGSYSVEYDAFVTKLNSSGTSLVYSTFLGGKGADIGRGIAVDTNGDAYITGSTTSPEFSTTTGYYPTTAGAFDTSFNRHGSNVSSDAFVTKLNPSGTSLVYSTFLGGLSEDGGYAIAVDTKGNAYVTGYTRSLDYPVTSNAYDKYYNGEKYSYAIDAFVAKFNASGNNLTYSTYLGQAMGQGIVVDSSDNIYVTGDARSADFPVTSNAYDVTYSWSSVFVTKISCPDSGFVSVDENVKLPRSFSLSQNTPNPFNPTTTIDFNITSDSRVVLKIYNLAGQEVATLKDEIMSAGKHSVVWNAKDMASGIYLCTVKAGAAMETRKMTLLK